MIDWLFDQRAQAHGFADPDLLKVNRIHDLHLLIETTSGYDAKDSAADGNK
jgi:hypothetical protein